MMTLQGVIDRYPDMEFLVADGYDEAVLGVDGKTYRLIYSVDKVLSILCEQGMTWEEAREFFDFNVAGAYVGEKTPIWCEDS